MKTLAYCLLALVISLCVMTEAEAQCSGGRCGIRGKGRTPVRTILRGIFNR